MKDELIKTNYLKLLFWFWFLCIFTLSLFQNIPDQNIYFIRSFVRLDYIIHFVSFAILGFIFVQLEIKVRKHFRIKDHIYKIMFLFGFGVLTELFHYWISNRTFSLYDMLFNILGLITAILILPYIAKAYLKKRS